MTRMSRLASSDTMRAPAAAFTGAPVGLLGLHSTTARVRSVRSRRDIVPGHVVRFAIGHRRFDGDGAGRLDRHLMIREIRRRQHDLVAGADERRQRGRERVIGAGRDQQVVRPAIDLHLVAQARCKRTAQ